MSKQILTAERPADGPLRQSIGNYKGVMLCNRPNDPTEKPIRDGPAPFISRVTVREQLGLNPPVKLVAQTAKSKRSLEILIRHKFWLSQLQKQKEEKMQKTIENQKVQDEKFKKMKKKYSKPSKIDNKPPQLPNPEAKDAPASEPSNPNPNPNPNPKPSKLTEKNLKVLDSDHKPKWAMTEDQAQKIEELEQEQEVENLLQFVSDLDYDKFINDLEVRQALEIVKERVEEIKKDKEWKQNIADKYNNENKSEKSKGSLREFSEKAKERIEEEKKKAQWDSSSRNDRVSVTEEERVAKIVADQVLANYPNLKAVHSNLSVRKMLEREAKDAFQGPLVSTVKYEKQQVDPSNLPYLHRNPAV